jgi:cell wall-associated NlpC family hydrolase
VEEEFRQKMASTRNTRAIRALLGAAILAGSLLVSPLTAGAAPHSETPTTPTTPTTSADVIAKLDDLAVSNDKLTEAFNKATADVATAQQNAEQADKAAVAARRTLVGARHDLAISLAAQYKGSSFSHTAALLASNSGQNYIEKMQSLSFLSMHQQEIASEAAQAAVAAKQADATAAKLVATAVAKRASLAAQRDALSTEIDKQKRLLASLTAAERARVLAQGTPSKPQVAAQVAQIAQLTTAPTSAVSKGAGAAVQAALSQQGKPYVWGAAGPDAYDCSGLTMWAWGQAGVSLPHQSEQQQNLGTPVDQSQLQPGDLVFFGSPAYHVGMYIGNGMMVHAPTSGDVVKVTSLSYMSDYSGARRVG